MNWLSSQKGNIKSRASLTLAVNEAAMKRQNCTKLVVQSTAYTRASRQLRSGDTFRKSVIPLHLTSKQLDSNSHTFACNSIQRVKWSGLRVSHQAYTRASRQLRSGDTFRKSVIPLHLTTQELRKGQSHALIDPQVQKYLQQILPFGWIKTLGLFSISIPSCLPLL
ncbi:hypothetical protein V6N12_016537 [Hibiscus sabdariffa]|uniref:Uncharacterized protein n=1 Tax=Hibiscus sabdariffa TaxID=183260 RepID=A0ABR2CDX3_9ROSI